MSPSVAAASPMVRRSVLQMGRRMAARRFESTATPASSTATKAAEATKETVSQAGSSATKAAQGLSRVTSAAGPAILGAAKGVSGALGRIGGRTGRLVAFAERQIPFVVYYSRVGAEVAKLVFRAQKMTPPPASTFQSYFQNLWKQLQNPSTLFQSIRGTTGQASSQTSSAVQQVRNVSRAQLAAGGVILAECLGFFTVGEIIGRFKLIGYHGETGAPHH